MTFILSLITSQSKMKDFSEESFMDVIIIGAGVSGLSAAYQIFKTDSNLTVAVLEAKGTIFVGDNLRIYLCSEEI